MNNEEYWNITMKHRQELCFEVNRLINISKGFYFDEIKHNSDNSTINLQEYDLLYFIKNSKRPYGNKDIEASICYSLGLE